MWLMSHKLHELFSKGVSILCILQAGEGSDLQWREGLLSSFKPSEMVGG